MSRAASKLALVLLVLTLSASSVAAQRVRVQVVDISGDRAFVEPGAGEGVRRGARIRFGRRGYEVVATTESYAVVEMGRHRLQIGARGTTRRARAQEEGARRLPPPQPLDSYREQWAAPARPAEAQRPSFVPLSASLGSRRFRLDVRSSTAVMVPLGDTGPTLVRSELRARLDAQLIRDAPFRVGADVALQLYFGDLDQRRAGSSRPVFVARQLQLSYGEDRSFFAAIGRLRRASSVIGTLDGARVQTPDLGGFRIAAFGGVVPEPDSGIPAFDASRFGVELSYARPDHSWRPSASLIAHGSTFDGGLDEKRLSGQFRLLPGDYSAGGRAELAFFAGDNVWNAPTAQLLSAGADISGRHDLFRWGLRGDYRVPERSRWLAAFLPPGYLCAPGDTDGLCTLGSDARYAGSADVELRGRKYGIGVMSSYMIAPENETEQWVIRAHARALQIGGVARIQLSGSATRGSLMDAYSGRLDTGVSLLRGKLDIQVHYRPTIRLYTADIVSGWDHRLGGQIYASWSPQWQIVVGADGLFGRDLQALLVQTHITWRPQLGGD